MIVYSQTGNALNACEKIKPVLDAAGHDVTIEKVEIKRDSPRSTAEITITNAPDPKKFDALVFASPVQAFSLAVPMQKYMQTIGDISGRKTALLVTKGLPFKWTGAAHAFAQLKEYTASAGAEPAGEIVIWRSHSTEQDMLKAAEKLKSMFAAQ